MDTREPGQTTYNKVEFEKTQVEVNKGTASTTQSESTVGKPSFAEPERTKSIEELRNQHHRVRKQPGGGSTFSFF